MIQEAETYQRQFDKLIQLTQYNDLAFRQVYSDLNALVVSGGYDEDEGLEELDKYYYGK